MLLGIMLYGAAQMSGSATEFARERSGRGGDKGEIFGVSSPAAIPEPDAMVLLGGGLIAIAIVSRHVKVKNR